MLRLLLHVSYYIAAYFIARRLKHAGDVIADGWAGGGRCSLTDLNNPAPYCTAPNLCICYCC